MIVIFELATEKAERLRHDITVTVSHSVSNCPYIRKIATNEQASTTAHTSIVSCMKKCKQNIVRPNTVLAWIISFNMIRLSAVAY